MPRFEPGIESGFSNQNGHKSHYYNSGNSGQNAHKYGGSGGKRKILKNKIIPTS